MCVGRYAEKMQWSEAKWNLFEMPAIDMLILCIPAECDNIKLPIDGEIASRGMRICYAIFAGISLRLCYIPAYAHQIPTGFFQSLLNNHRDNLYFIPKKTCLPKIFGRHIFLTLRLCNNDYFTITFVARLFTVTTYTPVPTGTESSFAAFSN